MVPVSGALRMMRRAFLAWTVFLACVLVGLTAAVALLPEPASSAAPTSAVSATNTPTPSAVASPPASAVPTPSSPPPSASPTRTIEEARIAIPRLGIDLPLAWGDIGRDVPRDGFPGATPESLAFIFPGSAPPGAGGNTYIYSHARVGMFLTLWEVRLGDEVLLVWPDRRLRYAVDRIVPRVDPADTTWLDPAGPERLTLQTSTGPLPSDPRFIVVARPLPTT